MGCGGCAARRAAEAARRGLSGETKYVWMSEDGMTEHVYDKEIEAKAKVAFKGGSYRPKTV